MRINYSEDEDFPGQFDLWQANCQRSLAGKRGQAALRELETALVALPEKRLIAGMLTDSEGGVCAVGAVIKHRGLVLADFEDSDDDTEQIGVELGMPRMVAWKVVEINDTELFVRCLAGRVDETPEERYNRVLAWVREQISEGHDD